MQEQDLFEWAKQMNEKYGFNEEQLVMPFINNNKKENKQNETTK